MFLGETTGTAGGTEEESDSRKAGVFDLRRVWGSGLIVRDGQ